MPNRNAPGSLESLSSLLSVFKYAAVYGWNHPCHPIATFRPIHLQLWNDEMELISVSLRQGSLWIEIIFKPNWFLPGNNLTGVALAGRAQVYLLAGYYPPSWCHNLPPAPLDIVPPPPLWCYNASLAWPLGGGRIGPIRARYGSTALSAGHTHHPPLLPLLAPPTALSAAI